MEAKRSFQNGGGNNKPLVGKLLVLDMRGGQKRWKATEENKSGWLSLIDQQSGAEHWMHLGHVLAMVEAGFLQIE